MLCKIAPSFLNHRQEKPETIKTPGCSCPSSISNPPGASCPHRCPGLPRFLSSPSELWPLCLGLGMAAHGEGLPSLQASLLKHRLNRACGALALTHHILPLDEPQAPCIPAAVSLLSPHTPECSWAHSECLVINTITEWTQGVRQTGLNPCPFAICLVWGKLL